MSKCPVPPHVPCPPPVPSPCPPKCAAPTPMAPCRIKPIMRGLHWTQTKGVLAQALTLSALGGACIYFFIGRRRIEAYRTYYERAEFEDWADEMARKGLFQSVPPESLSDYKKKA